MRKENLATCSLFAPEITPAAIVEPLREIPGNSAAACASPMGTECLQLSGAVFFLRDDMNSVNNRINAVSAKNTASQQSQAALDSGSKSASILSLNNSPITPAGTVATISIRIVLKGFLKSAKISFQNTKMTDKSVPKCSRMFTKVIPATPKL